jgi:hypothetical protein
MSDIEVRMLIASCIITFIWLYACSVFLRIQFARDKTSKKMQVLCVELSQELHDKKR